MIAFFARVWYNILTMKKITRTTIGLLTIATVFCCTAGIGVARAISTQAEEIQRELLSPDTYEEYLPLVKPTDIAVSEDYKAIADGSTLYLYDEKTDKYSEYTHNVYTQEPTKNVITKLQFDKYQNLYFIDVSTTLYRIDKAHLSDIQTYTAQDTGLNCSTFIIQEEMLYYTNVTTGDSSQISKAPLNALDPSHSLPLQNGIYQSPAIAYWDGELYFTDATQNVKKINASANGLTDFAPVAMFPIALRSIAIHSGMFMCTDANGTFYAYDLSLLTSTNKNPNELPTIAYAEGNFSALTPFGEYVYIADKSSVKRYDVAERQFDEEYEICNQSSAQNRLNGATETTFVDGTLYTADNGNARVSVYDTRTGNYNQPVSVTYAPTLLASDNHTLLAANDTWLALYSLQAETYGEELFAYTNSADTLTGITHVYGKYYCATKNNRFFTIEQTVDEESQTVWGIGSDTTRIYTRQTEGLTSDAYGYLYTLYGTSVYRYTETEFLKSSTQTGAQIISNLPVGTKKIAVDYERNVYAMTNTSIYLCKREISNVSSPETGTDVYPDVTEIVLGSGDVYTHAEHTPTLLSFSFGIEDNLTYLLYDGNYTVISKELNLPTVKEIPVNGVDEEIFSEETAEFTLLKTNKHALFVEFDIQTLKDAEHFPYLSHKRENTEQTVLKLGSAGDYHLVALFNTNTHRYHTYLLLKTSCQSMSADEYQTLYPAEGQKSAWLTNTVALYKFPYLNPLLTTASLPRHTEVVLLGEIGGLDHEYYQISYTENGVAKTGFIPKSYTLSYNPLAEKSEESEIGKSNSNVDAIWRFTYILLGLGAICILVDFLILKKRDED